MRKTTKKLVALFIGFTMLLSSTSVVSAKSVTYPKDSPAMTSGVWYSEIDDDNYYPLEASNTTVYSGECGMYFYTPSAGLSSSFTKSTARRAYINLMEFDEGAANADETICTYTGYFGVDSQNRYTVLSFTRGNTGSVAIESNNIVELYAEYYVQIYSGDTSRNVNAGILYYEMWVE